MTTEGDNPAAWDLVVIGGGTAGLLGARTAARLGARVLLIEADRPGGDCLWTGCVPSKALVAAASAAAGVRSAARFGIHTGDVRVDYATVRTHISQAIAAVAPADSIQTLQTQGICVLSGDATFTGPDNIQIGDETVTFMHALVATGARPISPPIPGLEAADYVTSETIWDLTELPERLVVVGGGSIGCELSQAFARLGSQVTVVEEGGRVLPREDPEASAVVAAALERDGVRTLTGNPVVEISPGHIVLRDGQTLEFDTVLMAVGRAPRTRGLGLEHAGVNLDARGFIVVDAHLRTSNSRIWAAGDVTGYPQFTHVAGVHGATAASNAVLGIRRKAHLTGLPRVTFTQPELAAVGADTGQPPRGHRVVTSDHSILDRAIADSDTAGFAKLVVDRRGRIVGATVVGPRAGETIGELALAVKQNVRISDLAATMHPYPTYNDAVWNAATEDYFEALERPSTQAVLGTWMSLGKWSSSRWRRLKSHLPGRTAHRG